MTEDDIDVCLNETYGLIGDRNLRKIVDRMSAGPNPQLIRSMMRRFFVRERTDENYDRSFRLEIKDNDDVFFISISVVTSVYMITRVDDDGRNHFIQEIENQPSKHSHLVDVLEEYGYSHVDASILNKTVDVPVWSSNRPTIFNALFADEPCYDGFLGMPWEA